MPKFKVGDRVRDKFKAPKPGDECVTGEVLSVAEGNVVVDWDEPDATGKSIRSIHPDLLELLK